MELIWSYRDYNDYLKGVLEDRKSKNPLYSLRAFSRDLEINVAQLSGIFHKKKGLSNKAALKIATKLGLDTNETKYFCELVRLDLEKDAQVRNNILSDLQKLLPSKDYITHNLETFKYISEWYHNAIVELTFTKNFKSDSKWIANKLGISENESQQAIDRLIRLNILTLKNGKIKKANSSTTTPLNTKSEAIQKFNKQILNKAIDKIQDPLDKRDYSTMTMAIDVTKIEEARSILKECRRKLCDLLESGEQTEVYCLSTQLFSLETQEKLK
jgi:uncharacterized protein (TIGR02147 family)